MLWRYPKCIRMDGLAPILYLCCLLKAVSAVRKCPPRCSSELGLQVDQLSQSLLSGFN